jgi:glucose-1-phosphate cytidylyltransferase
LVVEPFQRLVQCQRLMAYEHDGFFMAMDTFKDRQVLEDILAKGNPPWEVWNGVTTRNA